MAEKALLSREIPLLGFAMNSPLPIVPAELLQLQLLGRGLLVLRGRVITPLALGALERDDLALRCHGLLRGSNDFELEPSTRFELVTPSLPRTCSTPELRGLLFPCDWSGRRDSNPRPTAWKAVTLPTELLPPFGGEWRIRTSVGRGPADLQSAAFDRSANSPESDHPRRPLWSWRRDSNPRPADYKSAALPTELCQHRFLFSKTQPACSGISFVDEK